MFKQVYWMYFISALAVVLLFLWASLLKPTTLNCGHIGILEVARIPGSVTLDRQGMRYEGKLDDGRLIWQGVNQLGQMQLPSRLIMGSTNLQAVITGGIAGIGASCN